MKLISYRADVCEAIVLCFSAGSYEDWRSDQASFPAVVKGNPLDGWSVLSLYFLN